MGVRRGWGWGWKQLTPTLPRAPRTVAAAGRLVVVHVDALQLQVGVAVVGTGGVDAVLIGDDLPELRADLVTALTALDCNLRAARGGISGRSRLVGQNEGGVGKEGGEGGARIFLWERSGPTWGTRWSPAGPRAHASSAAKGGGAQAHAW